MRSVTRGIPFILVGALVAVNPPSAMALQLAAISVETSSANTGPWTPVPPGLNAPITLGDYIRISTTLVNDTGRLGHLCAENSIPFQFTYCGTSGPDSFNCDMENKTGEYPGQYWMWPIMYGDCPAALSPANPSASVVFDSADSIVSFDYNGTSYTGSGSPETAAADWIYRATRPTKGLDFRILAADNDDRFDCTYAPIEEGTGYDCTLLTSRGNGTLGTILATAWGGTLEIVSPLVLTTAAAVKPPVTRPAGVVYADDDVEVTLNVKNTGPSSMPVTACATTNAPAGMCVTTASTNATCGVAGLDPATPAIPFVLASGANQTFTWTFSVSGQCGTTIGALSWDCFANGSTAKTPVLSVLPAPLSVSATVWVDPDAGGPLPYMPLAQDGITGEIGPVYYAGDERFEDRITYRNLSGTDTITVNPVMQWGFSTDYTLLAAPSPVSLAPGAAATLTWRWRQDAASMFASACFAPGLFATALTALARGVNDTQTLMLRSSPFNPSDPCPGPFGCPVPRPATLLAPAFADVGVPYPVQLQIRNVADRPFTLPAFSAFTLRLFTPDSACGTVTASPPPPPVTWAAGELKSFAFTVDPGLCPGTQCYRGGVDVGPPLAVPCLGSCNDGVPYCDADSACTTIQTPGLLKVTGFTAAPLASCDDANECVTLQVTVQNTSGVNPVSINAFGAGSAPEPFPAGYAFACTAPPAPAVSPQPPLPFILAPNASQTFTFYQHAICGTTYFGAFTGAPLVGGSSALDPTEEANWPGPAPKVTITRAAVLSCGVVPGAAAYSTGQVITLTVTMNNEGEDDAQGCAIQVGATGTGVVTPVGGATPPVAPVLAGVPGCTGPTINPAVHTFQYAAAGAGTVVFTATVTGTESVCAAPLRSACSTGPITIATAAQLSCQVQGTPVVTLTATCVGCPLRSECNPVTGVGCINVTMVAANGGAVAITGATPAHGVPVPTYFSSCAGSACPVPMAVARTYPPEADVPGTIGPGGSASYLWTYSPTGLGCARVHAEFSGTDAGSKGALYCDGYSGCIDVLARYPLELRVTSVPAIVAPGQEFRVGVRVCNPGETPAGLQNGEPALQFTDAASGAVLTTEYAVFPPPATVLAPGACADLSIPVTASRRATPARLRVSVAEGDLFIARDAATGLPFHAVDVGGPAYVTMTDGRNLLDLTGPNPFRPDSGPAARIAYQVSATGGASRTRLAIYTLTGEMVLTLVDKPAETERGEVAWDGKTATGHRCASGVYLVRLECAEFVAVRKLALVR